MIVSGEDVTNLVVRHMEQCARQAEQTHEFATLGQPD